MKKKRFTFLNHLKKALRPQGSRERIPAGDKYLIRYLEALIKGFRNTYLPLYREQDLTFEPEACYVPLKLRETYRESVFSSPRHIRDLNSALSDYNYLLILGAAGSGKTTLIRHLVLELCRENLRSREQNQPPDALIPIPVTLRELSGSGQELRRYIDTLGEKYQLPKVKKGMEKLLETGQCILLLDGLDELSTQPEQVRVIRETREFVKTYPGCKVVVTSRISGYQEGLTGFMRLELMDFDNLQVKELIERRFGASRQAIAEALFKLLADNGDLEKLAKNPLLLSVIASLFHTDNIEAQKPAWVYRRITDVLLSEWDADKEIKHCFSPDKKHFILRKLAFLTHNRSRRTMSEQEMMEEVARHSSRLDMEEEQFLPFLHEIWQRSDMLNKLFTDTYEFRFLSLQEYYTALELEEREDGVTMVIRYLAESWWQEPIRFFSGVTSRTNSLIKQIRKAPDDLFYNNLVLSARCIADAGEIDPFLKEEIVQELWWLYTAAEFPSLKEKALAVLSRVKPRRITALLVNQLTDKEPGVRRFAAETLGFLGSPQVLPSLLMVTVKDKDSKIRSEAVMALGRIGSREALRPLLQVLHSDSDNQVRQSAAAALGLIGSPDCLSELVRILNSDKDSQVRIGAAEALGKTRRMKAIPQLIRALSREKETTVRWRLILSLGRLGGTEARDFLIQVLAADEAPEVRESAAEGLGLIGSPECVSPLLRALAGDKNPDVRGSAAYALGFLKSSEALPELIKTLVTDDNGEVRGRAAYALGRLGNLEAVPYLTVVFNTHQASIVRGNATFALGQLGGVEALPFLLGALQSDQDPYVRYRAAEALGGVGNSMTIPSLKLALKDDGHYYGWKVKDKAFEALENISKRLQVKIFRE